MPDIANVAYGLMFLLRPVAEYVARRAEKKELAAIVEDQAPAA